MWVAANRSAPRVTRVTPCSASSTRDREVIARRHLLAGEHDIAKLRRVGLDPPAMLAPGERSGTRHRRRDVEAQRVIRREATLFGAFGRAEMAAGARIQRPDFALRRAAGAGDLGLDRAPRAEAGIEQPCLLEPRERGAIIGEMLRLPADRPVPIEAEPGQILDDRRGVIRRGSGYGRCPRAAAETGRPLRRAARQPSSAERTCPRCR